MPKIHPTTHDITTLPNMSDYLQVDPTHPPQWGPAFLEHLFGKLDQHIAAGGRCLLLTLTKKSSEEVTNFLVSKWYKTYYLHSEIATNDRWEIINKLRSGEIDVLVGINLLREGIDLPEVTFLGILDADKEGFLRSTTSLIQIIGRAARNPNSEVILYADTMTESMTKALYETYRRRTIQHQYNLKHNINPSMAISNIKKLDSVKTDADLQSSQTFGWLTRGKTKRLKRMTKAEQAMMVHELQKQLKIHVDAWEFEEAAKIRDQLKELQGEKTWN